MSSLNEYGIIPHNEQYKVIPAEPVAWMVYTQDGKSVYVTDNPSDIAGDQKALPLYTDQPADELTRLRAENDALRSALNGMLTYYGMDEDEWSKPTHDAARAALKEMK